jgi:hypothetical protein
MARGHRLESTGSEERPSTVHRIREIRGLWIRRNFILIVRLLASDERICFKQFLVQDSANRYTNQMTFLLSFVKRRQQLILYSVEWETIVSVPCIKCHEVTYLVLEAPVALLLIKSRGAHWAEVWVGPRPVWTQMEKRKSLTSTGVRTPDRPSRSDSHCWLRYLSSSGHSDKLTEQDVDGSRSSNVRHHAENCTNKMGNIRKNLS